MKGKHNPFAAREGLPFLIASVVAIVVAYQWGDYLYVTAATIIFIYLVLVFRDPIREIPAVPLGVVSPVDGTVVGVGLTGKGALNGEAHKIIIRVDSLGTYTARCPVEGKIMDLRVELSKSVAPAGTSGLWVRTDEGDDVILQFHGHRFGLAPLAFLGCGERVGQGQRCAYLRLTRFAEVQLPINGRVLVSEGQRVSAGSDVLAKLPHP